MAGPVTRRAVLKAIGGTVVLSAAAGCGNSTTAVTGLTNNLPSPPVCDGVQSTSSVVDNHTHTVCVLTPDLTAPQGSGAVYTTSVTNGHSHNIALTYDGLVAINSGGVVTVDSSIVEAHTHSFTIQRR